MGMAPDDTASGEEYPGPHDHDLPQDPNPPHGSNTEEEMDVDDNDLDDP